MGRCSWAGTDLDYVHYHDHEWGRPVVSDRRLFEKLCLEGFQSGLSWLTVLRKRERFRTQFHDFDIDRVAAMDEADVERLLADAGIIRHRGKIEAAIGNGRAAQAVVAEFGSLAAYVWSFEPKPVDPPGVRADMVSETEASRAMSRDLKKRGFRFVGPTTVYAFMQAMGLVNDHHVDCDCRAACAAERQKLTPPGVTARAAPAKERSTRKS